MQSEYKTKLNNMETTFKHTKFTQKVKDKWIKALESGKYKQTDCTLHNTKENTYCCIGVLGEIIPGYSNFTNKQNCPYQLLTFSPAIGNAMCSKIHTLNDETFNPEKPDYSNILPLIKSLEVEK